MVIVIFVLEHQDGDIHFSLVEGGYAIEDKRLYISIKTRGEGEEAFPRDFNFALYGYRLWFGVDGKTIKCGNTDYEKSPCVFVYTTFHAEKVTARLKLSLVENEDLAVEFSVLTEDINYYSEKAKDNLFSGKATLRPKAIREMWFPS